jgi:hypothetical protein
MPSPLSRGQSHPAAGRSSTSQKAAARQTVRQPAGRAAPSFPVSEYAALQLHRPLSVFGRAFAVHLASALTLSPDTLLRAAADTSLQMLVRADPSGIYPLFRKLSYVGKGRHKLSDGLRDLTVNELSRFLPKREVERALDDPAHLPGARSPWAMTLHGLRAGGNTQGLLGDTCEWLSAWDDHWYHAQALIAKGERAAAEAYLKDLLGAAQHAWTGLNPRLAMNVAVLLEVTLTALARLECQTRLGKVRTAGEGSAVLDLLAPGRRPMGHWLRQVCQASSCANLSQLAAALLRRGAKHHGRNISHTLLKHWSLEIRCDALARRACSAARGALA